MSLVINLEKTKAIANGAEGVGLLRTQFLYLDRLTPPTEQEQLEFYQAIAQVIAPHPLTITTINLGGDKLSSYNYPFKKLKN